MDIVEPLNLDFTPKQSKDKPLTKGDSVCIVRNTALAAVMVAVGIPLRTDPPYIVKRLQNGSDLVSWLFHEKTPDGSISFRDCNEAWHNQEMFAERYPTHPITFAMHTILNYRQMVDCVKDTQCKFIGYLTPDRTKTIWVVDGCEKHHKIKAMGWERTDDHAEA